MNYFDSEDNVKEYLKMAEGYDGKELIEVLKNYLSEGAIVLELGMGPGKDLDILNDTFKATGSDNSAVFLDLYRKKKNASDLVFLDAVEMKINRKFDCIYSNKVLHHLKKQELEISFKRQHDVLNDGGILFHSFWYGKKEENHHGLRFVYYTEETIKRCIGDDFEIVVFERYEEIAKDDSFYIILKRLD